jgi:hypothetical protein
LAIGLDLVLILAFCVNLFEDGNVDEIFMMGGPDLLKGLVVRWIEASIA